MSESKEKKSLSRIQKDILTMGKGTISFLAIMLCALLLQKQTLTILNISIIGAIVFLIHWSKLAHRIFCFLVGFIILILYTMLLIFLADFPLVYISINAMVFFALFFMEIQRKKYSLPGYSLKFKKFSFISVIIIFSLIQVLNIYGTRSFRKAYLEVKKAKYPVSLKELQEQTNVKKIDEGENGVPLLIASGKILEKRYQQSNISHIPWDSMIGKKLTKKQMSQLEVLQMKIKELTLIIDTALSFKQQHVQFPELKNNYSIFELELPHLGPFMTISRVLKLQSYYFIQKGNSPEAIKTIKKIIKLSKFLQKDPFIISYLVRIAILRNAWKGISHLITTTKGLNGKQLKELQDMITPACQRSYYNARTSFSSELIFACDMINGAKEKLLYQNIGMGNPILPKIFLFMPKGWLKLDLAMLINTQLQHLDIAGGSEEKLRIYLRNKTYPNEKELGIKYPITSTIIPSIYGITKKELDCIAYARCLWSALEIKIQQMQTSTFHKNFNFITHTQGHFVKDPFTGKELQYKKSSLGYIIYSFGENMKDDGGIIERKKDTGLHIRK